MQVLPGHPLEGPANRIIRPGSEPKKSSVRHVCAQRQRLHSQGRSICQRGGAFPAAVPHPRPRKYGTARDVIPIYPASTARPRAAAPAAGGGAGKWREAPPRPGTPSRRSPLAGTPRHPPPPALRSRPGVAPVGPRPSPPRPGTPGTAGQASLLAAVPAERVKM